MANRKTCAACRGVIAERHLEISPWCYRILCPEHKRLRNRMQREAARGR